jgi:hypothetical protein
LTVEVRWRDAMPDTAEAVPRASPTVPIAGAMSTGTPTGTRSLYPCFNNVSRMQQTARPSRFARSGRLVYIIHPHSRHWEVLKEVLDKSCRLNVAGHMSRCFFVSTASLTRAASILIRSAARDVIGWM